MADLLSQYLERRLTCQISKSTMRDPVFLVQYPDETYDRESLCEWLISNPMRHPITKDVCDEQLQYEDDLITRELLIQHFGQTAYQRHDDSYLLLRDNACSTAPSIISLYGHSISKRL
jgi:hypothetical protein